MSVENEIELLVKEQSEKVRALKLLEGVEKADVDAEVKKLLELKSKLPKVEKVKEKKVDERALKKEMRRKEREAKQKASKAAPKVSNPLESKCGVYEMLQSKKGDRLERPFIGLRDVNSKSNSINLEEIWIRGFVHLIRSQSKVCFLILRQKRESIQVVLSDKDLVKFAQNHICNESVIDICAKVVAVEKGEEIKTTTLGKFELHASKVFVVSKATTALPFQVIDASKTKIEESESTVRVNLDTRLDSRCLDLRTPLSQSIVKVTHSVLQAFRHHLCSKDFIEICTPKLLKGASEGGSEVFSTQYFDQSAFLAQSPQLHKQLSCACSGLERVFEIGPVFRAENSNTNRHLCEFTGVDLEMAINEHYHEVLDVFSDLFHHIFNTLNKDCAKEIATVKEYFPESFANDIVFAVDVNKVPNASYICGTAETKTLKLEFKEGIEMLRSDGVSEAEQGSFDDLSTVVEKRLGELVKKKFGVDFYFLDKYPKSARPFYTMPCPEDARLSNSYDFFIRGQEIMSGAQRVHDPVLLEKMIAEKGIDVESLRFYIDAFKQGALPHGGGGVGLERVVMLFLGLPNIRLARLFPRDPQRLSP